MVPLHLSAGLVEGSGGALVYPLREQRTFNDLRVNFMHSLCTVALCRGQTSAEDTFGFKSSFQEQEIGRTHGVVNETLRIFKVTTRGDDIL